MRSLVLCCVPAMVGEWMYELADYDLGVNILAYALTWKGIMIQRLAVRCLAKPPKRRKDVYERHIL